MSVPPVQACIALPLPATCYLGNWEHVRKVRLRGRSEQRRRWPCAIPDIAIKGKGLLHVGKGYYTGQRKFEFGSDRSLLVCSHRPSTNSSFPHQRAELH